MLQAIHNELPNKENDSSKIIRVPGEYDKISWQDYTGCCKPGEYDAELDAFVQICPPYQQEGQGEDTIPHVPEHVGLDRALMLDKIKELRESVNKHYDKNGRVEAIVKALKRVEEETLNDAPRKRSIMKGKLGKITNVSRDNIIFKKRRGTKGSSEPGGVSDEELKTNDNDKADPVIVNKRKIKIKINDMVKIKTAKFGVAYARGRPEFTFGRVLKIHGKVYDVLWDDDIIMKTNVRHLIYQSNLSEKKNRDEEPKLFDKFNKETIYLFCR
jgi:hypothetical protein